MKIAKAANLLADIPAAINTEIFERLVANDAVRIERIVSQGHSSPAQGWYDQDDNEWVVVLQGAGIIEFESGDTVRLEAGDYVNLPAHTKHRVNWTDPDQQTIWLAVFYQ